MKPIFYFFSAILILCCHLCLSQQPDSVIQVKDTAVNIFTKDTIHLSDIGNTGDLIAALKPPIDVTTDKNGLHALLLQNRFFPKDIKPVAIYQKERSREGDDLGFYVVLGFYFFLGLLRVIFGKYVSNLFKVFFNTSLRQNQLTDQLKQDKLPSLFFNLFFMCVTSVYIYLLMIHFHVLEKKDYHAILYALSALASVYIVKYLVLLFIGWISGFSRYVDDYIFVVFLINKILAVFLLPVITFMAFSEKEVKDVAVFISYILIALMFILRYLRGFNLIQHSMKMSKFHFLIYVTAVELLPVLLIYRFLFNILMKSH